MGPKHRRDKNHGKSGWVAGNPCYRGKGASGACKGDRARNRRSARETVEEYQEQANARRTA